MLPRNQRQESLSRAYVRAVAAQAGVVVCEPDNDYGIDTVRVFLPLANVFSVAAIQGMMQQVRERRSE